MSKNRSVFALAATLTMVFAVGLFRSVSSGEAALTSPEAPVSASCAPTGGEIRLTRGVTFEITLGYGNGTSSDVQFTTWMNTNMFFGPESSESRTLPGGMGQIVNATIGTSSFPAGSGEVIIEITSDATGDAVLAVCDFVLTIVAPPTADADGPYVGNEGTNVTLDGSGSSDPDGDPLTYGWDLDNDGAFDDATGPTPTFDAVEDGVFPVCLRVTDPSGESDEDCTTVTVNNVAPVASIDSITDENGALVGVDVDVVLTNTAVDVAASFYDAGSLDTHTATINWGDGNVDDLGAVTSPISATHVYSDPCDCTITLTVTDDDTGVGTATADIQVVDASGGINNVIDDLIDHGGDPNVGEALNKLRGDDGGLSSNGALDMLEKGNLNAALEKVKQALEYLEAAEAADPGLDFTPQKGLLSLAGKEVAVGAIDQAEAAATKPKDLLKIQQAKGLVAQGDVLLAAQDYVGSVDKYQEAVREVENIH